jgi:single-strand DNA-binding protein
MKLSINKQILAGNVGAEPDARYMPDGTAVTSVRLATSKSYKDKDGKWQDATEWHTVKFFGKQAEYAASKIQKGTAIYVEGETRHRKWQDQDGKDRYATEVHADTLQIVDKGRKSDEGKSGDAPPSNKAATGNDGSWEFGGDDVPY